jgi:hypothetical protein
MPLLRVIAVLAALTGVTQDAAAQWLTLPTPGIPRLPDGKPDLTAPAPRTPDGKPDFSGLWRNDGGDRMYNNIAVVLEPEDVAPWADALYRKRRLEFGKDSMETQCLPLGPAYLTSRYREIRIVQTPALVVFLFDDGRHREIFMDGRTLEPASASRLRPCAARRSSSRAATPCSPRPRPAEPSNSSTSGSAA